MPGLDVSLLVSGLRFALVRVTSLLSSQTPDAATFLAVVLDSSPTPDQSAALPTAAVTTALGTAATAGQALASALSPAPESLDDVLTATGHMTDLVRALATAATAVRGAVP